MRLKLRVRLGSEWEKVLGLVSRAARDSGSCWTSRAAISVGTGRRAPHHSNGEAVHFDSDSQRSLTICVSAQNAMRKRAVPDASAIYVGTNAVDIRCLPTVCGVSLKYKYQQGRPARTANGAVAPGAKS
ncbi:hypothetical protein EVAR_18497_1 [Eumeta japonica]|uniref:Uncharacterized protein n=1 Tax=Eumeta variegata TaxID=151549 RepID=A0A4C1UZP5_EUMVA|nr:hypothetical protein EVAR_18497_1 [Eumeta japonica]